MHVSASDGSRADYRLSGVVEQVVSLKQSRHYLAHVKEGNSTWATKDKDTSSIFSGNGVLERQAYILLYSCMTRP